ncbi:TPA: hypothetical protein ACOEBE_000792 [Stenotrophomonas maltophilia]|uniref:hypothetical protein n=1 Tax=Stenotrophomonas maltophilia TaxID=40324 RepID=UPI001312982C|nr:hypothetical protein [Stenotrophomonas maltophilia]MCO7487921.1 hypothetical protein [Stenotrophomonas maltophilia]
MKIPKELVHALRGPAADLAKDVGQAIWESTLDGSALENIPVVSGILAIEKGVASVRDRLFARKVLEFLKHVNELSASDRARVVDEVAGSESKRDRLGELLLDKLDRADPVHKPQMLAKLYVAVGRRQIPASDFDRLSDMIINVFIGDLRDIARRREVADVETSRRFALQAAGYLAWDIDQMYAGGGATLKWNITLDGEAILNHCLTDLN